MRQKGLALGLGSFLLIALTSCGLFGKKSDDAPSGANQKISFNARDIRFFEISPEVIHIKALPNRMDSLAIGDLKRISSNFTGNAQTLVKDAKPKTFGEIGEAIGAPGAVAYDSFRPHLGIHSKFKVHFCSDFGFFRKLSIQEGDLRTPKEETFMLDWPTKLHDGAHTFVGAEKLPSGESQWRVVHYDSKKVFSDAYIFRFNPANSVLRQILVLRDQSFWMVETSMKYAEGKGWSRDESKPLRIKANFLWMKSEFDLAVQGNRVLSDWRRLSPDGTKVKWTRANMIGRWGTFSFRPQSPAFIPREMAIIDSEGGKYAAVYDLEGANYIRYPSSATLRALTPPKPEPTKLTFTDWATAQNLISAITVDESKSKTVEPKVIAAMAMNPETPCFDAGRLPLPIDFFTTTPDFRKAFNLPEPTPPPVPQVPPSENQASVVPDSRDLESPTPTPVPSATPVESATPEDAVPTEPAPAADE
jgi:hypothetical protein